MRMLSWVCVAIFAAAASGCADPAPAPTPPSAPDAATATYQGKTAEQWLDTLRTDDAKPPDEWSDKRSEAAAAFEHLRERAAAAIMAGLDDKRWYVREFCCFEIGKRGDAGAPALAKLVERMRDKNFLVTEAAETGFGNLMMTSAEARRQAIGLLSSKDAFVRAAVAHQMGYAGSPAKSALPEIRKLLSDPDPNVRESAKEAVELLEQE